MKTKSVGLIPKTTFRLRRSVQVACMAMLVAASAGNVEASPDEWGAMAFFTPEDAVAELNTPGLLQEAAAMSCRPVVNVSLNQLGYAVITPSMLVKDPAYPLDQYEVEIMGPLHDTVFCDNIGEEIMAVVEELPTGNTCMSSLNVEDKLPPTLVCLDDTIPCYSDIPSLDFLSFVDAVFDNCSDDIGLTYSYTLTDFDCNANGMAGRIDLTVAAVDEAGNSATCNQSIWLEKFTLDDVVFPPDTMLSCVDPDTSVENTGVPTVDGVPVNHFCEMVSWYTQMTYDLCSGEFKVVRLWNVMDWCTGQTRTQMQSILVKDTFPPDIECPLTDTIDTDPAVCYATYTLPFFNVTDVCSDDGQIETYFNISTIPGIFHSGDVVELGLGNHTFTITATDDCLTTGTCQYTITVEDNEAPVLVCHDYTTNLNSLGISVLAAESAQFFASDNCELDSIAVRKMTDACGNPQDTVFGPYVQFCCEEAGETIMVAFQAIDASGNENQCMIEVIVKDSTPPEALCKDIMVFLDEFGSATITPLDVDNGSYDNCEIIDYAIDKDSFTCADLHESVNPHDVTLTVTDASGNTASCISVVTVKDTIPPDAFCMDITIMLDEEGFASIVPQDVDNGSVDNCTIVERVVIPDEFGCDDVGELNIVKLIVTDQSGNQDSCTAMVEVFDNPPVVECMDATLYLDSTGLVVVTQEDIDAVMDDCGIASVVIEPDSLYCDNTGENTVTLTVTDVFGNTASCQATVTVFDTLAPECLTKDITVELDANGMASIAPDAVDDGSNDECGIQSISVIPNQFNCANAGMNVLVVQTVTDNNGNSSVCTAFVTVQDNNIPECVTQDITVYLDENGEAMIDSNGVDNGSSTACGVESITVDPRSFDCSQAGTTVQVVQTVTDVNGNTAMCTANVTVLDTTAPVCAVQDLTIELDENGMASLEEDELDDGSTDNCGIESITIDPDQFDCEDVGQVVVTQTVTDVNGNSATCTATVTIEDNLAPICLAADITVMLGGDGTVSIDSNAVDNGSNDECGLLSITVTPNEFDCEDGDSVIVTQTVTDLNGNTSECTATVFIANTLEPVALCQDITVYLDANGTVSITPEDIDAGSSVNCGELELTADPLDFDCSTTGDNVVTLTVTDESNQMASCTANVTVLDTIPPTILTQNDTVYLDDMGMASTTLGAIDNGSFDNCDVMLTLTPTDFDCGDLGDNMVTLSGTDPSGNMASAPATVTVLDTIAPVCASVDSLFVTIGAGGMVTIDADDIDDGSTDNCNVIVLSVNPSSFDCEDVGVQMATLTVTDGSGNTSTCTTVVVVEEGENLMAVCENITVQLNINGMVSITPEQVGGGSIGGCAEELTLTLSKQDFDCSDLGVNDVTVTVTDGINVDSCVAQVTVVDLIPPSINCPANVTVDCGTDISDPSVFGMATASDNCPVPVITEEAVSDIDLCGSGTLTRTFTATDGSGNSSTCVQVVTLGASGGFDETDIDWPMDVTLGECSSTDPEDIPDGEPVINIPDGSCALVSVQYEDEVMMTCDMDPGTPCIAIMRMWTVIDTCQLEDGTDNGIFTFIQNVIVDDNTGPVFSMVNDVTVTADPETCTGAVTLIVTATSCGDPVDVTNDFNDGGGNASGSYPIGQTIVTFTAEDECCNVSTLMVAVNVVDAGEAEFVCFKPVYCIPDELELTLNACEFIMFSNPDGCLTKDDYYFSYSNDDPFDSLQTWTCADAGSVPLVEIFTYDFQLNLVDSCLGDLDINDGPPDCPTTNCGNPNLNIQGEVFTEDGVMLGDVPVTISDLSMPMAYTAIDGSYAFANLQQGGNYVVAPQRNDNPLEGVTTLDLVAIQKHLLGIKPLTSPYQKIAADVIANGSISALDLLELRKMLLGYQQEFSDNTSWRFVDAHYDFPDPFNPFMIPFPEEMIIGELNHDMTEVDFIGVKTGDVNNTVSSIYAHDVEVSSDRAVALVYPDLDLDRGQTIRIPVSTVNFENIVGYQFELQLDTERIDFVRIELPDGTHLTEENFGLGRVDEGRILVSWSAASGLDVDGAHPIFEVVGIARSSGSANGLIELQSRSLHGEAYVDGNVETVLNLDLFLADQDDVAAEAAVPVSLMQNRPNPFNESTEIPLYLAQDGSVELLVHGIDGRLVYTERKDLNKGLHVMRISSKSLPSAGIYYYTVITDKFQATRRMTLLD